MEIKDGIYIQEVREMVRFVRCFILAALTVFICCGCSDREDISSDDSDEEISVSADSPNGAYRAEGTKVAEDSFSGLSEPGTMRIVDPDTGDILWENKEGLWVEQFLWSPDSRYLAVQYAGRKWTDTMVVGTDNWEEISMPNMGEISRRAGECPKPYDGGLSALRAEEWKEDSILALRAEWDTKKDTKIMVDFQYDIDAQSYSDMEVSEQNVG